MKRLYRICPMGWEKSGKTHFAVSVMNHPEIDPERVLYVDNHNSTEAFDLHQYSTKEPWGVRHIPETEPEKLLAIAEEVRAQIVRKKQRFYQAIVIDDISEQGLLNIAKLNQGSTDKQRLRNWGTHLDMMTKTLRLLSPKSTGAHLIVVARAGWMGDPTAKRDTDAMLDDRPQVVRPSLQGKFGEWLPFQFDLVTYQQMVVRGEDISFRMLLTPRGDICVANRWLKYWVKGGEDYIPGLAKELTNPTFQSLTELLESLPTSARQKETAEETAIPVEQVTEGEE